MAPLSPVTLHDVGARLGAAVPPGADAVVLVDVAHDSRAVAAGSLFCCVRGERSDGHAYAGEAVARGAVALVVDHHVALGADVPQLVVPDVRAAMGPAASTVHRDPSRSLAVVGVTGTNGKTTTTHLVAAVGEEDGRRVAVLGTLSGPHTTPEAPDLQRWLAGRRDEGVSLVAMEVSSHALAQHRTDGTSFAVSVFTNLSPEHLDYHGTMEAYFRTKARLFEPGTTAVAVVNVGDEYGRRLARDVEVEVVPFDPGAFVADARHEVSMAPDGCRFRWRGRPVHLRLGGRHNLANALAAAEVASVLGVDDDVVARGLSRPLVVAGRYERIEAGQPFTVVVDFAHTPDALARVLDAARETADPAGRVLVVFGCGGDRDAAKRPMMGEVAASRADVVVLTADNSRSERTADIIDAIRRGAAGAGGDATVIVDEDRASAVARAIADAAAGDVVVIAGKGHETTQILGDRTLPFDDREQARRALARRGFGEATA